MTHAVLVVEHEEALREILREAPELVQSSPSRR